MGSIQGISGGGDQQYHKPANNIYSALEQDLSLYLAHPDNLLLSKVMYDITILQENKGLPKKQQEALDALKEQLKTINDLFNQMFQVKSDMQQIEQELKNPDLTESQKAALMSELHQLSAKLENLSSQAQGTMQNIKDLLGQLTG